MVAVGLATDDRVIEVAAVNRGGVVEIFGIGEVLLLAVETRVVALTGGLEETPVDRSGGTVVFTHTSTDVLPKVPCGVIGLAWVGPVLEERLAIEVSGVGEDEPRELADETASSIPVLLKISRTSVIAMVSLCTPDVRVEAPLEASGSE